MSKTSSSSFPISPNTQQQQNITNNNNNNKQRLERSRSSSRDNIKYTKVSTSNADLTSPVLATNNRLDSNSNTQPNLDTINEDGGPRSRKKSGDGGKMRRNSSLMNFKSLDISLKSIYSSIKGGSKDKPEKEKSKTDVTNPESVNTSTTSVRKQPPFLKIEAVSDESESLLTYPQSPGSHHRRSLDTNSSTYLSTAQYQDLSASRASSPFLCVSTHNIRRSSTSDIIGNKTRAGSRSAQESRRPSTSDILRKARERKGSEGRLGRSVSQGGLPRGGLRNRRTSMAY